VGANKWESNLLNSDNGNVYSCFFALTGAGLKLQDCALVGLVCKGETWNRPTYRRD
jgi:uncharacterized protein (DUF2147 family)